MRPLLSGCVNSLTLNYTTTEVISQSLVVEILQLIRTNGD